MEPKGSYVLQDFKRYARKEFPTEFANFRDLHAYQFDNKTYLDDNNAVHQIGMLHIGHYYHRSGGPPVWAQATGFCIRYYYGRTLADMCKPIPEEHTSRIYYCTPYSSMIGESQQADSRTVGREASQFVIETVINVLFLLTGRLEQIINSKKTDMLSNFRYACMNTMPKLKVEDGARPIDLFECLHLPSQDSVGRENKKRKRTSQNSAQRIEQEEDDMGGTSPHSFPTGYPDTSPEYQSQNRPAQQPSSTTMPYRPARDNRHTSLLDQIRSYEADMESKLKQEKDKVQALQAQLDEQDVKIQSIEENLFREKKKRKRAEEQLHQLRSENATYKEWIDDLQAELV